MNEQQNVTNKNVVIEGDHNLIRIKQTLNIDDFDLDTFWKRLKWLFTGGLGTYMQKGDEYGIIVSKSNKPNKESW